MHRFRLKIFVAGESSRSLRAIENLRAICEECLRDHYELEVVDVLRFPERAEIHRILATPTVIREEPAPPRRVIGDLSRRDLVLSGLDLYTHETIIEHSQGDVS